MRLIDADKAQEQIKQMQTLKPSERMLLRLALDRTQTYDSPNEPLTLDELWEMDGEPVWSERYNMWMLIDIDSKNGPCVVDAHGGWLTLEQDKYYRRKLEANDED